MCGYDVATGATGGRYVFLNFFGGSRNCFCNFEFFG
jgi:hypothetical protein